MCHAVVFAASVAIARLADAACEDVNDNVGVPEKEDMIEGQGRNN